MPVKRGENNLKADYGIRDIYRYYTESVNNPLNYKEFKKYVILITSYIMHNILYEKKTFKAPKRMGDFRIKRHKTKIKLDENGEVQTNFLKPDWKKCWQLWHEQYPDKTDEEIAKIPGKNHIYHLNKHTDGYYNRFYWDKLTCNIRNHTAYSFKPVRKWKKELSRLSNQNEIYYE